MKKYISLVVIIASAVGWLMLGVVLAGQIVGWSAVSTLRWSSPGTSNGTFSWVSNPPSSQSWNGSRVVLTPQAPATMMIRFPRSPHAGTIAVHSRAGTRLRIASVGRSVVETEGNGTVTLPVDWPTRQPYGKKLAVVVTALTGPATITSIDVTF